MKKLIVFSVMLILFGISVFAQEPTKGVENSDIAQVERMIDKYVDKISDNVSTPAKQLFEQAVVRQKVIAIGKLVTVSILMIAMAFTFLTSLKTADFKGDGNAAAWVVIFSCIVFIAVFIGFIFGLPELMARISTPEYYAAREILELLK